MERSARLFNCTRCHQQVTICSDCDRGQIYCASSCAQQARVLSLRAAGARYQQTQRGKHHHAQRQKRYRANKQNKVTHHTSPGPPEHDVISIPPRERVMKKITPTIGGIYCHFCHQRLRPYVRVDVLHHPQRGQPVRWLRKHDP